ncbi:MAG: helix-turn-helix domain-containing protein [Alphaproteobacteria bacterium]|nr:helix-turn-helix domain-containing protein [Alphaproteobacteria bacterium]MDE2495347.1 helix-turn-helix domain-containing protein [Alphaproteobacteria bacterium]
MTFRIEQLGELIVERRGSMGVRAAAAEIGTSSATLSRIENGQIPDLETFTKICRWLNVNPSEILGFQPVPDQPATAAVHFRKDTTLNPATGSSLGNLIVAAQAALRVRSTAGK